MKSFRAVVMSTLIGLGVACSPAMAKTETPAFTVKYGDLNIDSEQGAQLLYKRLRTASRRVCASFEGRELRQRAALNECYGQALTKAVSELNVERLTALHQRKLDRAS